MSEIVILGAGPAGCTAAIALAQRGIQTTLIDKASFPRDKVCGDALSGKVVQTLKRLDPSITDRLQADEASLGSWGVSFVAPNGKALKIPFKRGYNINDQSPGYISKRIHFDDFMLQEVRRYQEVTVLEQTDITSFDRTPEGIELRTADGQSIPAKLVLASDGANSRFAKTIGGLKLEPKHHCAGVRGYYRGVKGLHTDGFIELHFMKEVLPGYFWIFPLPDGQANVGLGVRSDYVSKKRLNLKALLQQIVQRHPHIKERFSNAEMVGSIGGLGLPLGSQKRPLSGDNYLLLGDAGFLIDPFTGEGIGNAMISAVKAAEVVAKAVEQGNYDAETLQEYDLLVYKRLWGELSLSARMQQLVQYPWLFNLVVNKANKNPTLQDTISCMFEDLDIRKRLKQPGFYVNLLFNI